jgi:hypothetical protein
MPNLWLTPCAFLQEFNTENAEFVQGVMIDVTNDFRVQPFQDGPIKSNPRAPKDVRHVNASGCLQFTVIEERVIGINESRAVYRNFLMDVIDEIVPVLFLKLAERLIMIYS